MVDFRQGGRLRDVRSRRTRQYSSNIQTLQGGGAADRRRYQGMQRAARWCVTDLVRSAQQLHSRGNSCQSP